MFSKGDGYQRFLQAAVWPDTLRKQEISLFNSWHYINLPWTTDGQRTFPPATINLETVLEQSIAVLKNRNSNKNLRVFMLTMLIHLVGDATQPLHCINHFSQNYPYGDAGGNWLPIQFPAAKNLHAFWDQGLGLFDPIHLSQADYYAYIERLAEQFSEKYPQRFFAESLMDLQPKDWIKASYYLAINDVYFPLKKNRAGEIQKYQTPSKIYIATGQVLVAKQSALAGYRLADVLNSILALQCHVNT
jgi:hypothetical protein